MPNLLEKCTNNGHGNDKKIKLILTYESISDDFYTQCTFPVTSPV